MSYAHIELTPSEIALKKKYEWHQKVKKTLHAISQHRNQVKTEAETSRVLKRPSTDEAAVSTEQAKRLVKSGAMTIEKRTSKNTFKRSKLLDKKLKEGDGAIPKFQPYPAAHPHNQINLDIPPEPASKPVTPLTTTFVPGGTQFQGVSGGGGKTVFIRGYDLTENMLEQAFKQFGKLVKLHVEDRRRTASVEFESNDEAEKAISKMHLSMFNGVSLQVTMARRHGGTGTASGQTKRHVWSEIVDGPRRDRANPGGRTVVTYDDQDI